MPTGTLAVTGDPDADHLLNTDTTALFIGMLLDQQVPMEWAFRGPATLKSRLGHLDARRIAAMEPDEVERTFSAKPALHRFPGSMGRRTHAMCVHFVDVYDADPARIWADGADAATVMSRLRAIPGYGDEKAKIFLAILAKRMGATPDGWRAVAAPFGDDVPRSVADIDGPESLQLVRHWKKQQKAAGKSKAE